jgi:hypothetical protein
MRFLAICLSAGLAAAQTSSTGVYRYDANGRREAAGGFEATSSPGASAKVQTMRSANGRNVPVQTTEEKVLAETPTLRKVERIVQFNDESGRTVRTERVLVDEEKRPDGSLTTTTTTYRSNVNGNMDLDERSTVNSSKVGGVTRAETVTERKTISGTFSAVEKRSTSVSEQSGATVADSTVYRPDLNGLMKPEEREVVKTQNTPNGSRMETTLYNTKSSQRAGDGLAFSTQSVTETVSRPDGTATTVTDVYAQSSPGRASAGTQPQLKERLTTERRAANGGFVEAVVIQRPEVADGRLGKPQAVSETVCSGSCVAKKADSAAAKK